MSPSGYRLSRQAAAAEARYAASRLEIKAFPPVSYPGFQPGQQDGDNFRRNMTTVPNERLSDGQAAARGAALGLSATYACVNLLAGTIGCLPLMVYRTAADGVRTIARDHPLYWLLHDSPNYDDTSLNFWEFMATSIELAGNAYAKIERREGNFIVSLSPIAPNGVQVRRNQTGELEYVWGGSSEPVNQRDILHIRGPGGTALGGVSPLTACRQAFGAAMAADLTASAMFANGARPSGHMSTDKKLTLEQRNETEGLLQEKFVGAHNSGRPMLLDNGLKWEQITINPKDAEMLDSRKFSGEEICRIFQVPPAMVGYGDKSSNWGTGKEVDVLGFQKFSLAKRTMRIEKALQKQLLSRVDLQAGITIEFNFQGLLRADTASRYAAYAIALTNGWMTINEVRRLENLPPVPGGDVPRMQSQNLPIDQVLGHNGGPPLGENE